jgi:bacterioferritin-associated ferredoxin
MIPIALVCGDCVIKAAKLVAEEQAQRAADAQALRGQRSQDAS